MFISTEEKINIKTELSLAKSEILGLVSAVLALTKRVDHLESAALKPKKVKKPLTEAQKVKQREYQRAYQARRKAQKLAEGNTNVSA